MKKLKKLDDVKFKKLEKNEVKNITGGDNYEVIPTPQGPALPTLPDRVRGLFDGMWECIGL